MYEQNIIILIITTNDLFIYTDIKVRVYGELRAPYPPRVHLTTWQSKNRAVPILYLVTCLPAQAKHHFDQTKA